MQKHPIKYAAIDLIYQIDSYLFDFQVSGQKKMKKFNLFAKVYKVC